MFKKVVLTLFLLFSSFTLLISSIDFNKVDAQTKYKAMAVKLNKFDNKFMLTSSEALKEDKAEVNLDYQRSQSVRSKTEADSSEQTVLLLVFALFGFVMLSNRRGV